VNIVPISGLRYIDSKQQNIMQLKEIETMFMRNSGQTTAVSGKIFLDFFEPE